MKPNKNIYYVYVVRMHGENVYIGRGKGTRWKHALSGTSHIKAFNELFYHGKIDCLSVHKIAENLTLQESIGIEQKAIYKAQPIFNTIGTKGRVKANLEKDYELLLSEYSEEDIEDMGPEEKKARLAPLLKIEQAITDEYMFPSHDGWYSGSLG